MTLLNMGKLLAAKDQTDFALASHHPGPSPLDNSSGIPFMAIGGVVHWCLGYGDQALKKAYETLAVANRTARPFDLALAQYYVSLIHLLRREAPAAQEAADCLISLATEHGFPEQLQLAIGLRGWSVALQGHHQEGIVQLEESLSARQASGAGAARPYFLTLLAEARTRIGRFDAAASALTEALACADEQEERYYESEMHRVKGDLLLKQNRSSSIEALACLKRAVEVASNQSAKSLELRATMSMARLLASQGHHAEARTMLSAIYNWFTEGCDTADLKDAKTLLDELSQQPTLHPFPNGRPPRDPSGHVRIR